MVLKVKVRKGRQAGTDAALSESQAVEAPRRRGRPPKAKIATAKNGNGSATEVIGVPAVAQTAPSVQAVPEEIVAEMTPALRKVYVSLRPHIDKLIVQDLSTRFRLGKIVDQVMQDEATYGARAVQQLAQALGISVTEMYVSRTVYTQWPEEMLQMFLSRRRADGKLITYSHLVELVPVGTMAKRQKLLERVYKDCLSTRDLRTLVLGMRSRAAASGGMKPKSPKAALALIERETERLNTVGDIIRNSLLEPLETDMDKFSKTDIIERISGAIESFSKAFNGCAQVIENLQQVLWRYISLPTNSEAQEE